MLFKSTIRYLLVFGMLIGMAAGTTIDITTASLAKGYVDLPYSQTVQARGGCGGVYSWSWSGLPAGITGVASVSTLKFSGDPTTAGSYMVLVTVQSCGKRIDSQSYGLVVGHSAELSWSETGSMAGVTFDVYRSTISGGFYGLIQSGLTSLSFRDLTIANQTTYYYTVTAVGVGGQSAMSNQATAVVP